MSAAQKNQQQTITLYSGTYLTDIGKNLYLNEKTADVHFSFDSDYGDTVERVPAHKNILAAVSDVFDAMFYGDLVVNGDIHVTDASEAAFMEFLQFFYLDRVKLTMGNIVGVMHLGHKYNVPKCMSVCVRFLKDALTVDQVFMGINLAIQYDQQELLKWCENLITLNTTEVFQLTGFKECEKEVLARILSIDVFSCSEAEVFKACMLWVKTKSEQGELSKALIEEHLGDLYYQIRFTSMTMQELCTLRAEYESVLQSDFVTITKMIVQPEFQAEKFNQRQRHANWNNKAIVKCSLNESKEGDELPYFCRSKESVTFASDEPLLLGGFVCSKIRVQNASGIRDLILNLPVDIEISEICSSEGTNAKVLLTMQAKLQSKDATQIVLPHPIVIRPTHRYKISIGHFPDEHVYYSKELTTLAVHSLPHFVQLFDYIIGNGKIIGLISCLDFNRL